MSATAYSSLVSLMNVLTGYQHPTCPVPFDQPTIQTLLDKVTSLVEFLEDYYDFKASATIRGSIQVLERKMAIIAYTVENLIQTSYANRLFKREQLDKFPDLQNSIQGMDQIIQESTDIRVKRRKNEHQVLLHLDRDLTQMAAYSSLVSLRNILTRCQHPTCPFYFYQSKIQTLLDTVCSLVDFLQSIHNSQTSRYSTIQDFEKKITREAHAAEKVIESYCVNRVLDGDDFNLSVYHFSLQWGLENAIRAMDQIIRESDEVGKKKHISLSNQRANYAPAMPLHLQEERGTEHADPLALTQTPTKEHHLPNSKAVLYNNTSTSSSSFPPRDKKNAKTNTSEQLSRLINWITVNNPKCQIIPIVGMGGIGKTTLAANAFNSEYVRRRFDIRAWVTISQHHVVKNIIGSLLHDLKVEGNDQMDDEELKHKLYQELCGRRYLIVLDDIWDIQPWMEIRRLFPDNNNRSRILLTTRDCSVARGIGSPSTYEMEFLNDDESFKLLAEKVYGAEVFPLELEIVGKTIAKSCKGLPLAIVVISGLLKTCSKTLEYWKEFAENLRSGIWGDNSGQCLEILSMSYTHLPIHLKPCFLHMAVFKEDERVDVSRLINLWIAEGFIKPTKDMILDKIALKYLDDLIDRNLIMVGERSLTRKLKTVSMHDSLRELCLKEALYENFLCAVDEDTPNLQQRLKNERRISFKDNHDFLPSTLQACSIYVTGGYFHSTQLIPLSRFLRLLDSSRFIKMAFEGLDNIRYLAVSVKNEEWLSFSLPLMWNLQTLILRGHGSVPISLPSEIWGFPYLQHLEFTGYGLAVVIPDPFRVPSNCVLNNLQTIRGVQDFLCTDEVLRLIPNLKELRIVYYESLIDYDKVSNSFSNLSLLPKLEILEVYFTKVWTGLKLSFSPTLLELKLAGSEIPWEDMTIVGCLPNLQVLNLRSSAVIGNKWNPIEGEFQSLRQLSISRCPLSTWNAESSHFPRLECLIINMLRLEKIPLGIGEITSLESIHLVEWDNISIITSVLEILEERKNNQGDDDDLVITGNYFHGEWSEEFALESAKLKKWEQAATFKILHRRNKNRDDGWVDF